MARTAMILGAGRGIRLASMGLAVPKVLVEVASRPLLARQIDYLHREGVERVVINAHHLAEAIESFAGEYTGPVDLTVVKESRLLGTAGGVRNVLDRLGKDPFFVLYGDVVVDQPLDPIEQAHRRTGAEATLTVYETHDVEGKGTVLVDGEGWITSFEEKQTHARVPALVNAGLYMLEPDFVAQLPPGAELDFGHDIFPSALRRGVRLLAHRLAKPVIDVGTPEGLQRARASATAG
jgi:NDP-sugar pyrophosphorylase family protein